ncbi:MAG TPA: YncE family protein [Mycobacterium sp.]|nr:YncE family protein [Mycobacterium sp.]
MNTQRLLAVVAIVTTVTLTGCAHGGISAGSSSSAVSTTGIARSGVPTEGTRPPAAGLPPAAEPQTAPAPAAPPPGQLVPVGAGAEGVVVDDVTRTVAVATRSPDALVLLNADSAAITARIPLPGSVRHVELNAPGGPLLVPVETANALIRVDLPQGGVTRPIVTGTSPHDAAAANGTVMVSNELGGTVTALRGEQIIKVFTDAVQPAGMAAVGTTIGMIDARANTLTVYDADKLSIIGSTQAGAGPTHLVADRHDRMIATDTRGDAIRLFSPLPSPKQVTSIAQPGGPYGIAYDRARDRLWVASSGTNEVIGYDMSQQNPREIQRFPTAQNPYSLGVDASTGRLFVAGAATGVVQIINTAS